MLTLLPLCGWNEVVGFPVPFTIISQAGPFFGVLGLALWVSWKPILQAHAHIKQDLVRIIRVTSMYVLMFQVYVGFGVVLRQLHGIYKLILLCLLPAVKLTFRNLISRGLFHLEDLAPTLVVFSVDIFHALFVSSAIQSTASDASTVVIMAIDTIQFLVAVYDIHEVFHHIRVSADESFAPPSPFVEVKYSNAKHHPTPDPTAMAQHILKTNPRIRHHPHVAKPRHLQGYSRTTSFRPYLTNTAKVACLTSAVGPHLPMQDALLPILLEYEKAQLECVKGTLKLLHMTEFYVLIEFLEAMMAVMYGT
jgi:hypothetical protein